MSIRRTYRSREPVNQIIVRSVRKDPPDMALLAKVVIYRARRLAATDQAQATNSKKRSA